MCSNESRFLVRSFYTQPKYLVFVSLITATMGLVTWILVVEQRGTPSAYLATYGLLIPVALGAPIALIRTLDVRNAILMISIGGPFSLAAFRFLEGMYVLTWNVQLSRSLAKS
jgi:hypothetical protein